MDWFKLHLSFIRGPEFMGSEPVDRATWLALLAYCADQENGGVISDCASWGERRWMQTIGVMLEEVQRECELWSWDGDDLVIQGYDTDSEKRVLKNRKIAKVAGRKSGAARRKSRTDQGQRGEPTVERSVERLVEQRRGEKRREEERRGDGPNGPSADEMEITPTTEPPPPVVPKIGPTDLVRNWNRLVFPKGDPDGHRKILADHANEDLDRMHRAYAIAERNDKGEVWSSSMLVAWEESVIVMPGDGPQPPADPAEARLQDLFDEFGFERLYDASGVRGRGKVLTPETIVMGLACMHDEQIDEIEARLRAGSETVE